jgi:hypothetical protein
MVSRTTWAALAKAASAACLLPTSCVNASLPGLSGQIAGAPGASAACAPTTTGRLVLDVDQLGRILGLVERLGNDERHRLADVADALLRQQRRPAHMGGRAVALLAREHRVQRAEAALLEFLTGEHRQHPRGRGGLLGIN